MSEMARMFPVTTALIGLNFLVYFVMVASGASPFSPTDAQLLRWGADSGILVLSGQWWRIFTCMFVHIGIIHIALNMWCLWQLGFLAERVFGRAVFLLVYLYTGVSASLLSLLVHPVGTLTNPMGTSAGASGAIFGIAGALIPALYWGNLGIPRAALKATVRSLVLFAFYNLAIGAVLPFVDNAGHLGGLVLGLVAGALLARSFNAQPESRTGIVLFTFVLLTLMLGMAARFLWRNYSFIPHLARAETARAKGDYATAASELKIVTAEQPRLADAQFLLGNALIRMKKIPEAEAPLKRATELAPNSLAAWTQLCYVHDVLEKFNQAYGECHRALEIDATDPAALDNQASALIGLKRYDEAIAILQQLLILEKTKDREPMVEARNDLGQAYAESGRKKEAIDAYTEALKIDPKNEDAKQGLEKLSH